MIALPDALAAAVTSLIAGRGIAAATQRLSDAYRAGEPTRLKGDTDAAAYVAWRLPATYAAVHAALTSTAAALPGWAPRALLDVGAGPGTAAWAAVTVLPSIERVTFVERDIHMRAAGRRLAKHHPVLASASWDGEREADLVIAAYSLGEMAATDVWRQAPVCLIVEPGTPRGYATVMDARDAMLAAGMLVAAPCPHDGTCPMRTADAWCHFSQRLPRTNVHRAAKDASLPYEDEKYSFVACSRSEPSRCTARIVGHPRYRKHVATLPSCTTAGLEQRIVTKSDPAYKAARDATWGDCM